jgi:endonuclease/exonuclease/phosphatase family metal-dependent hydrolase
MNFYLLKASRLALLACASATLVHAAEQTFVLADFNIHHDKENWPARQKFMVQEFNRQKPDVICLQEVLQTEDLENQAQTLSAKLGWNRFFFSSFDDEDKVKRYGNAILSKHPILSSDWIRLNPENRYRTAAHVVIDLNGTPVDVYCTHLESEQDRSDVRMMQVQNLLRFIKETRKTDFCLVAGDFNADPLTDEIQYMRSQMDDVYEQLHPGTPGLTTPVPHGGRKQPRRIDYIFCKAVGQAKISAEAVDITFTEPLPEGILASDHFGLTARFILTGATDR